MIVRGTLKPKSIRLARSYSISFPNKPLHSCSRLSHLSTRPACNTVSSWSIQNRRNSIQTIASYSLNGTALIFKCNLHRVSCPYWEIAQPLAVLTLEEWTFLWHLQKSLLQQQVAKIGVSWIHLIPGLNPLFIISLIFFNILLNSPRAPTRYSVCYYAAIQFPNWILCTISHWKERRAPWPPAL